MSEDMSENQPLPLTAHSLAKELRRYGMAEGQTVIVHMAMSKLNWVVGGAQAVIMALLDVLGESGTLMMPTHTTDNTDPAKWQHPPVPESWWQLIRDHMPPYDARTTPTRQMGAVAELFRTWDGTIRSNHPAISFAAKGLNAKFLIDDHILEHETGERSPIGRLYELDGYVLLLGVEHWKNTSLHLAEERADYPGKKNMIAGSSMLVDGQQQWVEYEIFDSLGDDFGEIGSAFDEAHQITVGKIANAEVRFFKQRLAVDFAVDWIEKNRDLTKGTSTT
jgi:aminoglycoside 3-N-acetyltransferase